MRRSTVGGYQGPVVILNGEGDAVAQEDERGEDHWNGQLHRIDPPDAVLSGTFRLRLPEGEEGEMTVREVVRTSDTIVYFDGLGRRPR